MLISEERRFRNCVQNPLSSGLQLKRLKEDKFQNWDLLNGENKHNHGNTEKRVDGGRQYCDGLDAGCHDGLMQKLDEEQEKKRTFWGLHSLWFIRDLLMTIT